MFQNQIFASLKDFSSRLKNTIVKIKQIQKRKNSIGNNCDESYKKILYVFHYKEYICNN